MNIATAMEENLPEPMRSGLSGGALAKTGWIYAFGLYQPRWKIGRYLNSDWTQAVVMAKRKSEDAIEGFGRIIARHLETDVLLDEFEYVITHVPEEQHGKLCPLMDIDMCATEILAYSIHRHLRNKANILVETLLVQLKPKAKRQHQCVSDRERADNVRGIYAVTRSGLIAGKIVMLVDDVLTSGATMRECADVLKSAGAKSVMGIALAQTARVKGTTFINNENGLAA